tara:strand:- start:1144 stop:1671 length:528 start_codon:yes stop_codon:yes gene_type:complete
VVRFLVCLQAVRPSPLITNVIRLKSRHLHDIALPVKINPYRSPLAVQPVRQHANDDAPTHLRLLAGLLVISGLIYVPTTIWLITVPGYFIWIGWAMVAFNAGIHRVRWFWAVSILWNLGVAALLVREQFDRGMLPLIMTYHSLAAVAFSVYALLGCILVRNSDETTMRDQPQTGG